MSLKKVVKALFKCYNLFMEFYSKFKKYGLISIIFLFIICVVFKNKILIDISIVLILLWVFSFIPVIIINKIIDEKKYNKEHKSIERTRTYNIKHNSNIKPFVPTNNNLIEDSKYTEKSLVTECEKYFLKIIEDNFKEYRVIPQVPLSSIVDKQKEYYKQYQNELYRTIDIGIFDKDNFKPLLMIEINDNSHNKIDRKQRDLKVKNILDIAHIPLITFYTNLSNKPEYIVDRIKKELYRLN